MERFSPSIVSYSFPGCSFLGCHHSLLGFGLHYFMFLFLSKFPFEKAAVILMGFLYMWLKFFSCSSQNIFFVMCTCTWCFNYVIPRGFFYGLLYLVLCVLLVFVWGYLSFARGVFFFLLFSCWRPGLCINLVLFSLINAYNSQVWIFSFSVCFCFKSSMFLDYLV